MKRILQFPLLPLFALVIGVAGMSKLYFDFEVPFARSGIKNIVGFYVFTGFIIYGLLELFLRNSSSKNETGKNIRLLVASMFIALFIGETVMRCLHVNATYSELINGIYSSAYMKNNSDTLHIIPLNSPKYLHSDEFNYPRPRNNEGFRDSDFVPNLDTTKILIQTYGDSFTEGDGAPMDSSYPTVLRKMLQQNFGTKFMIQNFGLCGSDPAFSYKQFQHIGLKFHPDILVLTYCSFDFVFDFFTRGGLERFGGTYLNTYRAPALGNTVRLLLYFSFGNH